MLKPRCAKASSADCVHALALNLQLQHRGQRLKPPTKTSDACSYFPSVDAERRDISTPLWHTLLVSLISLRACCRSHYTSWLKPRLTSSGPVRFSPAARSISISGCAKSCVSAGGHSTACPQPPHRSGMSLLSKRLLPLKLKVLKWSPYIIDFRAFLIANVWIKYFSTVEKKKKKKHQSGWLVMAAWFTSAEYILEIKSFSPEPAGHSSLKRVNSFFYSSLAWVTLQKLS